MSPPKKIPHATGRGNQRGVTLVEVVIVMLLVGLTVMTVVVVGYLAFRDKEELKAQARKLAGFLEAVRTQAAITGETHIVQYDLDDDRQGYFVWVPADPDEDSVYEEINDEPYTAAGLNRMPIRRRGDRSLFYSVWIDEIAFGDGSNSQDSEVRVNFQPRGGSHWHYVYLRNLEDEYYTIEVNPFTGKAEVYEGNLRPAPPEVLR